MPPSSDLADPAPSHRLSLHAIAAARSLIDPVFLDSAVIAPAALSRRLGCALWLKDESDNPIGCFKGRGAALLLRRRIERGQRDALVCASAGNFGLAMAYVCGRHGVELTVFVAHGANATKVAGIERLGACVVHHGADFDAAKLAARAHADRLELDFIEDGVEVAISEGAGTLAIELAAQAPALDALLVPLGNGALLAGVARWMRAHAPRVELIGVCSAGADVMQRCWRQRTTLTDGLARADTIADGIAVRIPVAAAVNDLQDLIDDVVSVDDASLVAAMRAIHEDTGLCVEPSAATGIAAIAADPARFGGRRIASVITGRNLTPSQFAQWYA